MSALYTPPTWDRIVLLEGTTLALNQGPVCYAVYRIAGVWYTMQTPGMSNPDVYTVDIDPVAGRLFITTPTLLPDNVINELQAFNPTLPAGTHPASFVFYTTSYGSGNYGDGNYGGT